jgi:lactoylglutathione lyase
MKFLYTASLLISFFMATAQTPKLQLNHIAVYVKNLQQSTQFYQTILGLDTIPQPFKDGKHTWFTLGAAGQLHLISGATTITPNKNNHLCFSVANLPVFIAHLTQHHIVFENWLGQVDAITKRTDGVQQIYFTDPNGYWLEVNDDVGVK